MYSRSSFLVVHLVPLSQQQRSDNESGDHEEEAHAEIAKIDPPERPGWLEGVRGADVRNNDHTDCDSTGTI